MMAVSSIRPDVMVIAAARVGGIMANATYPVDFLNDNLRVQTNLFEAAHAADVPRLLFLGSSCVYPRDARQPISESALLTGPLEVTNRAYAVAKIAGLEAVRAYRQQYGRSWISAMPTNLYGPRDNFDPVSGHVLPALIHRFHHADDHVVLWGTGAPRREFLFSDDAAEALITLLDAVRRGRTASKRRHWPGVVYCRPGHSLLRLSVSTGSIGVGHEQAGWNATEAT